MGTDVQLQSEPILTEITPICIYQNELDNDNSDVLRELGETEPIQTSENATVHNLNDVDVTISLVGIRAPSWEDFSPLYKKHAATFGFSFKQSTARVDKKSQITFEKYFVCSCSGETQKKENPKTKRKKCDTRTGCNALLRVKLIDGAFEVVNHNIFHNHPLTRPEWQHMHRVERKISEQKGKAMKILDAAGIRPAAAYRYFVKNASGEENVGHTKKDHLNFVNRERRKEMDGNDAQCVLNELTKRRNEDPDFYFKPLLGEGGKLVALYWRDSKMRYDYDIYGELVVLDTTYKTNKYDLICAPFVGVNNHWNNVMFGCAFIADEKAETFSWLLREFLESMGNKKPVTIFTDQDAAMAKAIAEVLGKDTRHRLCLWHLYKNAYNHCGRLKTDKEFSVAFDHCLKGCFNRLQFEESWSNMIKKFNLQDHDWFTRMYSLKEKWSPALNNDFFSAGILSSQRSESTNNAISYDATKTTSLQQFFVIFSNTVDRWRNEEKTNEFKCSWSKPRLDVATGLLKHAAEVYTPTIYYNFEEEFMSCLVSRAEIELNMGRVKTFLVCLEDEDIKERGYLVTLEKEGDLIEIKCNCRHFEEVGWLCSHYLRVMYVSNVKNIPDKYIKKRWTKDAKKHVWDKLAEKRMSAIPNCDMLNWREHMTRRFCDLVLKSETNMDARRAIDAAYTTIDMSINEIISRDVPVVGATILDVPVVGATIVDVPVVGATSCDMLVDVPVQHAVLDPDKAKTKGRRGKNKQRFGKRKATSTEIISKPRNEHLI